MLNKIMLMGRLTRDPELRRTQSGVPLAVFTLAVDRGYDEQNGEKATDFIDWSTNIFLKVAWLLLRVGCR